MGIIWAGIGVLTAILALQILLSFGFPLGMLAMGGRYRVLPLRLRWVSALAATLLACAIVLLLSLGRVIYIDISPQYLFYGGVVFGVYLCINTVMNLLSASRLEKACMAPASALAAFCFLFAAFHFVA